MTDVSGTPEYQAAAADREARKAARALLQAQDRRLYEIDGLPTYRDSFAIFLDTLGTKATTTDDSERLREVLQLEEDLRNFLYDEDWDDDHHRLLAFSDNIVIGAPYWHRAGHPNGGLWHYLASVGTYQFNTAIHGMFMRGGIARGPLYISDFKVDGAALIDAYRLENETAVVPRVLLSAGCADLIVEDLGIGSWTHQAVATAFILRDATDGHVFCNYLTTAAADEHYRPGSTHVGLSRHKKAVEHQLKVSTNDAIRAKYEWVAGYHNFVTPHLDVDPTLLIEPVAIGPDSEPFSVLGPPA